MCPRILYRTVRKAKVRYGILIVIRNPIGMIRELAGMLFISVIGYFYCRFPSKAVKARLVSS